MMPTDFFSSLAYDQKLVRICVYKLQSIWGGSDSYPIELKVWDDSFFLPTYSNFPNDIHEKSRFKKLKSHINVTPPFPLK